MTLMNDTENTERANAIERINDLQWEKVTDQGTEARKVQEIEDEIQRGVAAPDDENVLTIVE